VPGDVLARRLQVPGDLSELMTVCTPSGPVAIGGDRQWTDEQLLAIERRDGDMLLAAGAGSGKTSVLVERFVRAVLEDGVDVSAILTITFTEKAAAEMRDRIRVRLRELGAGEAARQTEAAFISTIHGFCARVLRAHALSAGIDPAFTVLDEPDSRRLADAAFDEALEELAQETPGGVDLIAAYGAGLLRGAILATYDELRSRGELHPTLPPLPPPPDLSLARDELRRAAAGAAAELGAIDSPTTKVVQALERLSRCDQVVAAADPWPGDLWGIALPGGNGAALTTPVCVAYGEALARFRMACEHRRAERARGLLDRLLRRYGECYAQRKRDRSGLDFEDLELTCRELLRADAELRERYRTRFSHIMVDELQDTNKVQLELIESIADANLFTVGDAQQSIYAFRHADVELFERRGERLAQVGARATLQTNFRSRREILEVLNLAFAAELGERFEPLRAGRLDPPASDPRVELLVVDKGAEWAPEGLASPWRLAEARALAARVAGLVDRGAQAREIVVLTRATSDLRVYERELEQRGIPTYVIGGRGYWSHPQVVDLVGYLAALANPRDEEALYTVLASPLVGVSVDALVVLAAAGRACGRDPWWIVREPEGRLDDLGAEDRGRLAAFAAWFERERAAASRIAIEDLIDRALEQTGYDLALLAMPGGRRRLANVRKLMRLAREHEAIAGRDLRGFLDLVARRSSEATPGEARESEAPVEGEALDAVRLMTIHRAKGLEFEIVCVADLGRGPRWQSDVLRVGRDGRLGLRLAEPGTGKREPALDYRALGEERMQAEAREERRLFYVAMTRAKERLILSGAAKLESWPESGSPIAWIGPAVVSDLPACLEQRSGVTEAGVSFAFLGREDVDDAAAPAPAPPAVESATAARSAGSEGSEGSEQSEGSAPAPPPAPPAIPTGPPVSTLSYSSLGEYKRCGYRFYAERVLGLPPTRGRGGGPGAARTELSGTDRGVLVHALLERLDFRRPLAPTAAAITAACEQAGIAAVSAEAAADVTAVVEAFAQSEACARLGRATQVRREERFGFLLEGGVLVTGALDVLAREPGRMLVVDYKSDRLEGADPTAIVAAQYATQRLIYALAVLRSGAAAVQVAHLFLERPDETVVADFTASDMPRLEAELAGVARGVLDRKFRVTDVPERAVCEGCPAEGGLCSWPLALTRREAPDRLF
jgi:ATP-dependent helicase/nuclease subunit A